MQRFIHAVTASHTVAAGELVRFFAGTTTSSDIIVTSNNIFTITKDGFYVIEFKCGLAINQPALTVFGILINGFNTGGVLNRNTTGVQGGSWVGVLPANSTISIINSSRTLDSTISTGGQAATLIIFRIAEGSF